MAVRWALIVCDRARYHTIEQHPIDVMILDCFNFLARVVLLETLKALVKKISKMSSASLDPLPPPPLPPEVCGNVQSNFFDQPWSNGQMNTIIDSYVSHKPPSFDSVEQGSPTHSVVSTEK